MTEEDSMRERIEKRIEELKAIREQLIAQLNACNGSIAEMEALLKPEEAIE